MKKNILTSLIVVFAIGAMNNAFGADDNREKLKSLCAKSADRVWVESDGVCVPKNPCEDTSGNYVIYCQTRFNSLNFSDPMHAINIVQTWVDYLVAGCTPTSHFIGADNNGYITCVGGHTGYRVFKFGNLFDADADNEDNDKIGWCLANNGYINESNTYRIDCVISKHSCSKAPFSTEYTERDGGLCSIIRNQ
ncbi:MAG: hypothetical protein LBL75_01450 [Rickettsiales bacterium]|nr:hypothetical protein [Rickettsiales bacterium]